VHVTAEDVAKEDALMRTWLYVDGQLLLFRGAG
jgi:hypothetical protein